MFGKNWNNLFEKDDDPLEKKANKLILKLEKRGFLVNPLVNPEDPLFIENAKNVLKIHKKLSKVNRGRLVFSKGVQTFSL